MTYRHIVSLVPSLTETLTAWGIEPVACTRFCERPDLPHVGGTKDPNVAAIVALHPDLVVLDVEENRREDYEALVANRISVHCTRVRDVDDVAPTLVALGRVIGLDVSVESVPPASLLTRRAFVPIWRRPWMALGSPTYGSSLLARLGIASVFAGDGPYPSTTIAEARARHPDLVIAPSEPYPFSARHRTELEEVAPTTFVDGRDLVWWGVRTIGALARLRDVLG